VALPDDSDVIGWVNYLSRVHEADLPDLREFNSLYDGTAPLHYLHPEILREVEDRIQAVALGWPMLAVEPLEERLDVLGFAYPEDGDVDPDATPDELVSALGDKNLAEVWEDNGLEQESQMGHIDALLMRRAYAVVGAQDDGSTGIPLTTVESPLEMFALIDPRTRQPRAALKRWKDDYDFATQQQVQNATLYLPKATIWFDQGPTGWREIGRDEHLLGTPPVAALTNRGRLADRYGRSELTPPLLSLSHAANKIATDMMVAAEFHAIPLRALFGVGPEDFEDASGNRLSGLQLLMSRLLTVPDGGVGSEPVRAHEFSSSSLNNFHDTLGQLARHVSGLLGLDPSVLGMSTGDNPASADALRSRETRLIKRAERKQGAFGGGWNRWAQLVRRFQDGDWDPAARRVRTQWRDAATPTRAQAADAALKLVTGQIIPKQQAREDLGYTPGQQRRMEAQDKANAAMDPIGQLTLAAGRGLPEETAGVPGNPGDGPPVEE
jgi:hypothetical protein